MGWVGRKEVNEGEGKRSKERRRGKTEEEEGIGEERKDGGKVKEEGEEERTGLGRNKYGR